MFTHLRDSCMFRRCVFYTLFGTVKSQGAYKRNHHRRIKRKKEDSFMTTNNKHRTDIGFRKTGRQRTGGHPEPVFGERDRQRSPVRLQNHCRNCGAFRCHDFRCCSFLFRCTYYHHCIHRCEGFQKSGRPGRIPMVTSAWNASLPCF